MSRQLSDQLCECGCGKRTFISDSTNLSKRGKPNRFIATHQNKKVLTREDRLAYQRAWKARNPSKTRSYKFKSRYGITIDEYNKIRKAQNNKCAICKKITHLNVDHNHSTNQVRGLLCDHCNYLIGNARENTDVLVSAILYLRKWNA